MNRRRGLRRNLLRRDRPHQRRKRIHGRNIERRSRPVAPDHRSKDRIAAHQQAPRAQEFGGFDRVQDSVRLPDPHLRRSEPPVTDPRDCRRPPATPCSIRRCDRPSIGSRLPRSPSVDRVIDSASDGAGDSRFRLCVRHRALPRSSIRAPTPSGARPSRPYWRFPSAWCGPSTREPRSSPTFFLLPGTTGSSARLVSPATATDVPANRLRTCNLHSVEMSSE